MAQAKPEPRSNLAYRAQFEDEVVEPEEQPSNATLLSQALAAEAGPEATNSPNLSSPTLPSATAAAAGTAQVELVTIRNPHGYPPYVTGIGLRGVVVRQKPMSIASAHAEELKIIRTNRSRATRDIPEY